MLITNLLQSPPDPTIPTVATDMEGTLCSGQMWKGLRDYLAKTGRKSEFQRFMLRRIHKLPLYALGLVNKQAFREQWMVELVGLYAGYTRDEFDELTTFILDTILWPMRRQVVLDEMKAHQDAGRRVVICSGMPEPMLQKFAEKAGLEAIGTPVRFENDLFTGEILLPFTTNEQKVVQMRHFLPENGRLYAAYGDTFADVPLLSITDNPCAVSPDSKLRQHAQQQNWRILEDG